MRTCLADFECLVPSSVDEALQQQAMHSPLVPIAGGTDIVVTMNAGKLPGEKYQSLHRLARAWRYVRNDDDGGLRIGALATYTDVRHFAGVRERYPLLVEAARVTGAIQIQNRGTLVGNVANASPAADTVPVLLVYDAELLLVSRSTGRWVELSKFYTGYRQTVARPGELIAAIRLPPPRFRPEEQYYRKVGTRGAQAISKVIFAGARGRADARLAWGSVAPTTIRTHKAEQAIAHGASAEEVATILESEIAPIGDVRSTQDYRAKVSRRVLLDFLSKTKS